MGDIDIQALREMAQVAERDSPFCGRGEAVRDVLARLRAADVAKRDLVIAVPALLDRIEALEAERAEIDSLLARRSALDGCTTRAERIQRCIEAAAVSDPSAMSARLGQAQAAAHRLAVGIMRCIDAGWRQSDGRDWTHPELVLAEYVDELRAAKDRAEAELAAIKTRTCETCRERHHLLCERLAVACRWVRFCGLWQPKEGK